MIKTVHLIFKTHLDVGYTDFARNVVTRYFDTYIPQAIRLAQELRRSGASGDRFIWTTGSWLIYEYLEQARPAERAGMERAIAAGDIAWHGLPFTTHSELMDANLFRTGLGLSQELDRRFGKQTIAAKMTDVPGHTRGIVPLLAEAGVRFLHIGVNPASTPPAVPPVFRWRDPSGAEVMVMYQTGYGEPGQVAGLEDAIAFGHTGDNLGPQSVEQIGPVFAEARRTFAGAHVMASTLDAFAARLLTVQDSLPVVTEEIGDTWIHGGATDPRKIAQYRELLRLRHAPGWPAGGLPRREPGGDATQEPVQPDLGAFERKLLLVPEHTWGLDVKTRLRDWENYSAERMQGVREQPNYRLMESSWAEKRGYIDEALACLPEGLQTEARSALRSIEPARRDLAVYASQTGLPAGGVDEVLETTHFRLRFDGRGALVSLFEVAAGREWAGPVNPLGLFIYQSYSVADYERFYRRYIINKRSTADWSVPDFTKPGMGTAGPEHREWLPSVRDLYRMREHDGWRFLLTLALPDEASQSYGCPRHAQVELHLPDAEVGVYFDLQWFDKPATRLAEALWFSFSPRLPAPRGPSAEGRTRPGWRLHELGQWVSPQEVVRNGNRHLHGIEDESGSVRYEDVGRRLQIESLDAALVAPDRRDLLNFDNRQPARHGGVNLLLYDNLWGTNFPMWCDDDARFRFVMRPE